MTTDEITDRAIRSALGQRRTIAVVGFSANPARPSHGVARVLRSVGHRVIPVNPEAGDELLGDVAGQPRASFTRFHWVGQEYRITSRAHATWSSYRHYGTHHNYGRRDRSRYSWYLSRNGVRR